MYAIVFNLNDMLLEEIYKKGNHNNAYFDIKNILQKYGFTRYQRHIYFGNTIVDAEICIAAITELTQRYEWFSSSVKDIRMLRIEDNIDLLPIIQKTLDIVKK